MALVITNLFSAIPFVGQDIVQWLWGGFSVSNPTIQRFFALHYLVPFIIAALVIMHFMALHVHGSSNPLGITGNLDRLPMHGYFVFKDLITVFVFLIAFSLFVFYSPNTMGHKGVALTIVMIVIICAICWEMKYIKNISYNNTIKIKYVFNYISNFIKNSNIVKIYYNNHNQQETEYSFNYLDGSSETTRTYKNKIKNSYSFNQYINYTLSTFNNSDNKFNQWLAGLIDGDGYFGINSKNSISLEILVSIEDEPILKEIQNKFGGSIHPRSGVKALRYRLQNKPALSKLVTAINGNIRNTKRLVQFNKVCILLNIDFISPIKLTKDNSWFIGFFDADGTINYYYRNKDDQLKIRPQLTISVTNKYLQDVQDYASVLGGNIYFDKSQNGYYKWSINNEDLHIIYYNYNLLNPSKSYKGKRLFLINEFYTLYNLKAFRYSIGSALNKAWVVFDNKWKNNNI